MNNNIVDLNEYRAPASLPAALRNAKAWLVWRLVQAPGEPKALKVPYYTNGKKRYGSQGTAEDLAQLVTFDKAVVACRKGGYSGVGFAFQPGLGIVGVDFDDCVKDGVIRPDVAAKIEGTYAEFSPSGTGIHAFFAGNVRDRKDNNKKGTSPFEVEYFCSAGYLTFTGNVTPECEMFGLEETLAPYGGAVKALYEERFGEDATQRTLIGDDDSYLMSVSSKIADLDLKMVYSLIDYLDPDCGYHEWLQVGQSLHFQFDGAEEALEAWREWSQKSGGKYPGDKALEAKWESFGRYSGPPITGAYFLKHAHEAKRETEKEESKNELQSFRQQINDAADEFVLRERVAPAIAKAVLVDLDREALAQALVTRFKALGVKYPIAQVRKLVQPPREKKERGELPDWLTGWVYVTDEDQFFRLDSDECLTMQGFNARFNRELPPQEDGGVRSASWVALEDYGIPVVTRRLYLPWAGPMFEESGVQCVNKYRPSSVPRAEPITPAGRQAVALVLRHLRMLCGGREDVALVILYWLAFCVQNPGVKIRWSPLIKGIEGDGKSLLGTLLTLVMGRPNVTFVSAKVLETSFNGFAEGYCVAVLEELKMTGHNRHDTLNALKPLITNDSIPLHRKGRDEYAIINVTNYLAFTNHADALPLGDTDRRWMIVFTPFANIDGLAAACGLPVERVGEYFDELHAALQQHPAELRQWLLDVQIPESFNPNGRAPMTDEKAAMVAAGRSVEEDCIRELIAQGSAGISASAISTRHLKIAIAMHDEEVSASDKAIGAVLTKLGYTKWPKRVRWNGELVYAWIAGSVPDSLDAVIALLDKTATAKEVDFFSE